MASRRRRRLRRRSKSATMRRQGGEPPMAPHSPEILRDRERALEDEFFRREDQRLLEHLGALRVAASTREALAKASGITDPVLLDMLVAHGIKAETVAALSFVPLLEVAWADGRL